jgi:hypothetical protein
MRGAATALLYSLLEPLSPSTFHPLPSYPWKAIA